ncbi:coenzyme F420-0:L-glutamate ligase [Clostridium sp. MB40-C1]|uniref:coenzyme F420-0:L-glutamate ligase n=1 Tax=Clostridium sp. MB40-C1 TaxID=3070996 RepID=UPI0027E1C500|nr:coenzyme F420-0:L-glutamate ligase [Clostridium sp. MB40-C1]WMJ81799.1 coenzyme F420-0:L-glutamate ligase [Clostridium sp. MB40-C1]
MPRTVGTTVRGVRAPIVKEGDNLVDIVVESVLSSMNTEKFTIKDRDVIGITESLVARSQGNYISVDDIAKDVNEKFEDDFAVVFPILSRNRFSLILKGLAKAGKKIYLLLNYPSDEVGNHLIDIDKMDEAGVNPYTDVLTEKEYRKIFGEKVLHPFTGIDYVQMYKDIAINDNIEIILANDPRVALNYTKNVLVANIHERHRTKRLLKNAGAEKVYGIDEILNESINGSGFNPQYGLLGSNMATDTKLKLFPRDCDKFVEQIQNKMKEKTGKHVEVMVYGDGAFKDPVGKIWELADPVVSPGYTSGLSGTPNEIKLKYIADNELKDLKGEERAQAIKKKIIEKENNQVSEGEKLGTTPRQLTDLLGSLCDLTSGSGDKGTPIVLIQGYFDTYATE